jgi:hypothetical protein
MIFNDFHGSGQVWFVPSFSASIEAMEFTLHLQTTTTEPQGALCRRSDVGCWMGWSHDIEPSLVWGFNGFNGFSKFLQIRNQWTQWTKIVHFSLFFSSLRLCRFCCAPWGAHLCEGTAMKIANLWNLWCFIAVHSYLMLLDVTWFQYRNMFNLQTCSNTTHRNTSNLRSSAWGSPHI